MTLRLEIQRIKQRKRNHRVTAIVETVQAKVFVKVEAEKGIEQIDEATGQPIDKQQDARKQRCDRKKWQVLLQRSLCKRSSRR